MKYPNITTVNSVIGVAYMEELVIYSDGGSIIIPVASGHVQRCVSAIADVNIPDAEWAAKVLNQYGHLVRHEGDMP